MNCPNCGAAMHLNTKGVFVCAHCGTNRLAETADRGGIRILGPSDSSRRCALCRTPFLGGLIDDYPVEYCDRCDGILLNREDFAELVRRRRASAETASVIPTPTSPAELRRKIKCPKCGLQMTTDWYYGPGHVVMDRCTSCDLVWLDHGELKQIIDAPGIDRGSHDVI